MFSEFIAYKILTIKDYYLYIENIPLEEEDNYRINILNFLYENIDKDKTVLLNNIPKSLNELIKKVDKQIQRFRISVVGVFLVFALLTLYLCTRQKR